MKFAKVDFKIPGWTQLDANSHVKKGTILLASSLGVVFDISDEVYDYTDHRHFLEGSSNVLHMKTGHEMYRCGEMMDIYLEHFHNNGILSRNFNGVPGVTYSAWFQKPKTPQLTKHAWQTEPLPLP